MSDNLARPTKLDLQRARVRTVGELLNEDAARFLALTNNPNNPTYQLNARNLAVTGSTGGGTPRVRGWSLSDVTVDVSAVDNPSATYSGGAMIQVITVSTDFVDPSLGFLGLLGLTAPTISVSHQERYVGGSF